MEQFAFDPAEGFKNTESYPEPAGGTASREQLMSLHEQTRDFINNTLIPEIDGKQTALNFDAEPTEDSTNPVTSGGVYTALSGKQDTLAFDDTPTSASDNPVKSSGIYDLDNNSVKTKSLRLEVGGTVYIISVSGGSVTATPEV